MTSMGAALAAAAAVPVTQSIEHFDVANLDLQPPRDVFCRGWSRIRQVSSNGIENRVHHGIVTSQQQTKRCISYEFLRILIRSNQCQDFGMAKVYIVPQDMNVDKFPNIFFPRIRVQSRVASIFAEMLPCGRKLFADIRQFFVNAFLFFFLRSSLASQCVVTICCD